MINYFAYKLSDICEDAHYNFQEPKVASLNSFFEHTINPKLQNIQFAIIYDKNKSSSSYLRG